jgi:ribonucleoside-diphosphate reductase alpha chain
MLSENAMVVLKKRYFQKDDSGNIIEDWDGLIHRIVSNVIPDKPGSEKYEEIYALLHETKFLPNSPTLFNAGTQNTLSGCFHFQIPDSMREIMDVASKSCLVQKFGGGVGFDFSLLRPNGTLVTSSHGRASGPVSFLKLYSAIGDTVTQAGKRSSANLASLRIDHPDIEDFLTCKKKEGVLANFNISVKLTGEFMDAVEQDKDYDLVHGGKVYRTVKARSIFNIMVDGAWKNGEPGLLYWDNVVKFDPLKNTDSKLTGANPCGEQVLANNEACTLASVDLSKHVLNGQIDWVSLKTTMENMVYYLDYVVDANHFPEDVITEAVRKTRKLGIGVMGWADLLYMMGIRYGSPESLDLAENVMAFIQYVTLDASCDLARIKAPFPLYDQADFSFIKDYRNKPSQPGTWEYLYAKIQEYGLRNATTTTIAPTGTIGIIANASGGIEPNFEVVYMRTAFDCKSKLKVVNPVVEQIFKENLLPERIFDDILAGSSIQSASEIPDNIKKYLVVASDVTPEDHINMQVAFQQYTMNAISKTINLPFTATREQVAEAILRGHKAGLKGFTVYRDGSRDAQVLEKGGASKEVPDVLSAKRIFVHTPQGKAVLTVSYHKGQPVEIYIFPPDKLTVDTHQHGEIIAICRCIALSIQGRTDLDEYIKQLKKALKFGGTNETLTMIQMELRMKKDYKKLLELPMDTDEERLLIHTIHKIIELGLQGEKRLIEYSVWLKYFVRKYGNINSPVVYVGRLINKAIEAINNENGGGTIYVSSETCPECGQPMSLQEGCMICIPCNYSKCG